MTIAMQAEAMKTQTNAQVQMQKAAMDNQYKMHELGMKDDLELYPFVKTKARKTIIEPIIEKRLAEASEQKRLNDE